MAGEGDGGSWVALLNGALTVVVSAVSIVVGGLSSLFIWGKREGRGEGSIQIWRDETDKKIASLVVKNETLDVKFSAMRDRFDDRISNVATRADLSDAANRLESQIIELRKSLTDVKYQG